MALLSSITASKSTHNCPSCTTPTYCSITTGKSASACWCMAVPAVKQDVELDNCLCKKCLLTS